MRDFVLSERFRLTKLSNEWLLSYWHELATEVQYIPFTHEEVNAFAQTIKDYEEKQRLERLVQRSSGTYEDIQTLRNAGYIVEVDNSAVLCSIPPQYRFKVVGHTKITFDVDEISRRLHEIESNEKIEAE